MLPASSRPKATCRRAPPRAGNGPTTRVVDRRGQHARTHAHQGRPALERRRSSAR
ncbi:MAG: hypothetical protein MZU84_03940 [Sphingobacterium sp.]|nr:hypothetical protein [Sphingobacterium sp.]